MPCLSQTKYEIENKPYYCYSEEDNKIIAVLLDDRNEYLSLIELCETRNFEYMNKINILESNIVASKEALSELTKRMDIEIGKNNALTKELCNTQDKLDITKKVAIGSGSLNVLLILIIILL